MGEALIFPVKSPHFLTKSWSEYDGCIPFIISDLITAIKERNGFETDGIFRVKVENVKIDERYESLDSGKMRKFPESDTAILLSCVLKKVLQTLCMIDPLFTIQQIQSILQIVETKSANEEDLINELRRIVIGMDKSHRCSAAYIISFLGELSQHSNTRMDAENLSICIGVCIYPKADATFVMKLQKFLRPLIEHADKIFEKEWYSDDKIMTDEQIIKYSRPIVEQYDIQIESERRLYQSLSKIPIDQKYNEEILEYHYPIIIE
ncbi:RhoGAP domain containing protein [Trichomonas vaginalis G3]|uniref:RhoGAP domain containing protein n=1 Tax=Trichomonas vaginalis (strain ATCC PRA-98 / G3) TaxID=412133 RepID=A2F7M7_TRIV3|nr:Rho GTPase-activating protein 68f family [Trichomonas vaginalis G3]EAX99096.1 RhoGAP domain containing protein [Trichomonas vaginalis G3]KAI5484301.1 Rho GTPase-activating protein 68f family [Trichomonas vaginalis G3]|eukprot:XP_001312026.1 RhoGAP domain containing protein [Trichomonas vaginalis G3]